ncbi:MAG: type II toxin-antitoxin system VapC family toxin [Candidatus Methylumidiphilus sp.]
MSDFVLDASVLVKWAVPENAEVDTDKALDLLADFEQGNINLLQPIHWLCEVGAVLCRISAPTLNRKIQLLRALEIPVIDNPAIFQFAGELAVELDHHLFDTLYHAVALENNMTLVTADRRYYQKAYGLGGIVMLEDFGG